jgi:branched-chain amino acid transport system ATP-binding protein
VTGALVIRGLSKSFGGVRAVADVDLEVARGQVHSLIGPNGAGKTTLFNCIAGALQPNSGQVLLDGRDVTGWPPHRLVSAGMARTYQVTKIFGDLTVYENVGLAVRSKNGENRVLWRRADTSNGPEVLTILERLGLAERAYTLADHLAHGEKRVLEIAIAMGLRPRVLLLDEPTAGMSSGETELIAKLIRGLTARATVLLVEHDMDMVLGISDIVTVMAQGSIIATGSPAAVSRNPHVQSAYLGTARGYA